MAGARARTGAELSGLLVVVVELVVCGLMVVVEVAPVVVMVMEGLMSVIVTWSLGPGSGDWHLLPSLLPARGRGQVARVEPPLTFLALPRLPGIP